MADEDDDDEEDDEEDDEDEDEEIEAINGRLAAAADDDDDEEGEKYTADTQLECISHGWGVCVKERWQLCLADPQLRELQPFSEHVATCSNVDCCRQMGNKMVCLAYVCRCLQ